LLKQLTAKQKAAACSNSRSKKYYQSSILQNRRQLQVVTAQDVRILTEQLTIKQQAAHEVRNIVRAAYYKTEGSCMFQLQK
jgi:hypothetical protein